MAVVKILKGSKSFSAVKYNEQRCKRGEATLVKSDHFPDWVHTIGHAEYLRQWSSRNKRIKNPQLHVTISLKGKEMNEEELVQLGKDWLKRMGYGENPYLIYYHKNTEHPHIHIVTSRVDSQGQKIDDSFEKERSVKTLRELEGVSVSYQNHKTIASLLRYSFSTRYQFMELCKSAGFNVYATDDKVILRREGHKTVLSDDLIKFCSERYHREVDAKEKKRLQALFYKYSAALSKDTFQDFMRSHFGIEFVFYGKDGTLNGYTIIDHHNRCVYKGSQIFGLSKLAELMDLPQDPSFAFNEAVSKAFKSQPFITPAEFDTFMSERFHYLKTGKGQYTDVLGGEVFHLDERLHNRLAYNERVRFYASQFHTADEEAARIVAKACRIKAADYLKLAAPHATALSEDELLHYRELVSSAMASNMNLVDQLMSHGIILVIDKDSFYLLDSVTHHVVSNSQIGLDFRIVSDYVGNNRDNYEDMLSDYGDRYDDDEAEEFFTFMPSLDLAGLIYTGPVSSGVSNKKKRRPK